jgi:hypothetical protein
MTKPSEPLKEKLEALRASYAEGLPAKIAEMETTLSRLASASDLAEIQDALSALRYP